MKSISIASVAVVLLAGCQTVRPVQITISHVNHQFRGLDANEFFYRYGLPTAEFNTADGRKTYDWVTPEPHAREDDTTVTDYYEKTRTTYRAHDSSGHETDITTVRTEEKSGPDAQTGDNGKDVVTSEWAIPATPYCQLEIQVNQENIIEQIVIANDSIGKRSASRCSEFFSTPSLL